MPVTDVKLAHEINKKNSASTLKEMTDSHVEKYSSSIPIYTDASKTEEGRVAAAFYVENIDYGLSKRLKDHSSIYSAELAVIEWL